MNETVGLRELAELTGEPVDILLEWQRLGLLHPGVAFTAADAERIRLVRFAAARGVSPAELAGICSRQGDLLEPFTRWAALAGLTATYSLAEAAQAAAIDVDLARRVRVASGAGSEPRLLGEDVEALRLLGRARAGGLPDEVLLQLVKVLSDSLGRVADAGTRLFHLYVHEALRGGGLSGPALVEATDAIAAPLLELVEPAILYFHRRAWAIAQREDLMLHLAEEVTAPRSAPGELTRAILFVDLSSFTPLTEMCGDVVAAQVVDRFSDIVREAAADTLGQVVKQIGDAFMLVFPTPGPAVACGLAIERAAAVEPRFPAVRVGVHAGPVLYREGDYLGVNVNIAARVAAAANRHQLLVTDSVRAQADGLDGVEFVSAGGHRLKGISEDIALFEARIHGEHVTRPVDPVCGMELDEATAEVRLTWRGEDLLFCAAGCLQRFASAPERFASEA